MTTAQDRPPSQPNSVAAARVPHWFEIEQASAAAFAAGDFPGALARATLALEEYIRAAADAPPDKAEKGAKSLSIFAFTPPDGRLTRHLSGSIAEGISLLMQGIFQSIRNPAHHASGPQPFPPEVVQALDTVNYALGVAKRLAAETYLDQFLASRELRYLLKVRHLDIDGDGQTARIVTYSRKLPQGSRGAVLVTTTAQDGTQKALAGRLVATRVASGGEIIPGLRSNTDRPVIVARFGDVMQDGSLLHETMVFDGHDGVIREYQMPQHAQFSEVYSHEVRDHLVLGIPQLITYSQGGTRRHYWLPGDGVMIPAGDDEDVIVA